MALFEQIVVFRQTGVGDSEFNSVLSAVIEFLEFCSLSDKVVVKWVKEKLNLNKYVVKDENDQWSGCLDGIKMYPIFAEFVARYFDKALGILLSKDLVFSLEKTGQRYLIRGFASRDHQMILVCGFDTNCSPREHEIRMTTWHELGHVFDILPTERTESFVITHGEHKHCVDENCVMHVEIIPSEGTPVNKLLCDICQRYLKLFLQNNFE